MTQQSGLISQTSHGTEQGVGRTKKEHAKPQPPNAENIKSKPIGKSPDPQTQKNGFFSSAAAIRKSAVRSYASGFIYITLDPLVQTC